MCPSITTIPDVSQVGGQNTAVPSRSPELLPCSFFGHGESVLLGAGSQRATGSGALGLRKPCQVRRKAAAQGCKAVMLTLL